MEKQQNELISLTRVWARQLGWKVFPVVWKEPVKGLRWSTEEASESQWKQATGLGLRCGNVSGVSVVDIDAHRKKCPAKNGETCSCNPVDPLSLADRISTTTPRARTPSGGFHLFFSDPNNELPNSVRKIHEQVDTKGFGGFVVIPPSKHEVFESLYEWVLPPIGTESFEPIPNSIKDAMRKYTVTVRSLSDIFRAGSTVGERRQEAPRLAGAAWHIIAGKNPANFTTSALDSVVCILRDWNQRNEQPLTDADILHVAKSIGKTHYAALNREWDSYHSDTRNS